MDQHFIKSEEQGERLKNSWLLAVSVSAVFLFLFVSNNLDLVPNVNVHEFVSASASAPIIQKPLPDRLVIPRINVDAHVESVGYTAQGAMDAPKGPDNVGWLYTSPLPGEAGNAVIDGHRGWKDRIPAVFDRLHELRTGDHIYVRDTAGAFTIFVVKKIKLYNPGENASDVFGTSTGAHLNLITCYGAWDIGAKSYTKRLVVFADIKEW